MLLFRNFGEALTVWPKEGGLKLSIPSGSHTARQRHPFSLVVALELLSDTQRVLWVEYVPTMTTDHPYFVLLGRQACDYRQVVDWVPFLPR